FRYSATTPGTFDRTLTQAAPTAAANFGFGPLATIGDYVFYDANINGTQDFNEIGIANATVKLEDVNNNVLATTTTSATGFYLFTGLQPGAYTVVVDTTTLPAGIVNPPGLPASPIVAVADPDRDGVPSWDNSLPGLPAPDNDDDGSGGNGIIVNFGTNYAGADFGYEPSGVVGDFVFRDTNGNGIQD